MQSTIDNIISLFQSFSEANILSVDRLPQSGGDRVYFRLHTDTGNYIATFNTNIKENNTFISFSKHFKNAKVPVPDVYAVNADATIYIQQDFGDASLLHELETIGHTDKVYALYQKSLKQLKIKGKRLYKPELQPAFAVCDRRPSDHHLRRARCEHRGPL